MIASYLKTSWRQLEGASRVQGSCAGPQGILVSHVRNRMLDSMGLIQQGSSGVLLGILVFPKPQDLLRAVRH